MVSSRYVEVSRGQTSIPGSPGRVGIARGRRTRRLLAFVALAASLFVASYSVFHEPAETALEHFKLARAWTELAALDYSLDDDATIDTSAEGGGDGRHAERVCVVSVVDPAALARGTPRYQEDHQEAFDAGIVVASVRFAWALRHGSVRRAVAV